MASLCVQSGIFAFLLIALSVNAATTGGSYSLAKRLSTAFNFAAFGKHQAHHRSRPICDSKRWREKSLKLIKEVPFAGLFNDLHGESKFEASGLVYVNGSYFVVFDSHRSLGSVNEKLEVMSNDHYLIGEIGEESQYEGITYKQESNTFLVVQESHEHGQQLKPAVEELMVTDSGNAYDVVSKCDLELELTHANKGVEGIQYYDAGDKGQYLLAICEGNFCTGGRKGQQAGNGRIIVSQLEVDNGNHTSCRWVPTKTIHIPATAAFQDYSGMAFHGDQIGIISQEEAALWVGSFDFDAMDFSGDGVVYHFPRDNNCDIVYCTVEGLSWIDSQRITVTLDRAKADQPFVCTLKDQSIAMFALPYDKKQ